MRYLAFASAIAVVIAGTGCGGTDGPPDLTAYFAAQPYANPACNNVDERLAGQREMRLYVNGAGDLPSITLGLARYYHRHGLAFFTTAPPQGTTMAYALDTNKTALAVALIAAFPDVDFSDEAAVMSDPVLWPQIVTFVTNFMLKPMVDFANTHSEAGGAATNLIVVPEMERPGGEPIGAPGNVAGGPGDFTGAAGRVRPHHARRGGDLGGREPARQLHADDGPRQQRAQARGQHRSRS